MSEITVNNGQNLWRIVKKEFGLTNNTEIANKVNEIAKANNLKNGGNSIYAGQKISLPESLSKSNSVFDGKNAPAKIEQTPVVGLKAGESSANITVTDPTANKGSLFDKWVINTTTTSQSNRDKGNQEALEFTKEHSKPEEKDLRYEKNKEISARITKENSNLPSFSFVGEDFVKDIKENNGVNAAKIYQKGLLELSQTYIKNTKDIDGDAKTVNFEEYWNKELEDTKKLAKKTQKPEAKLSFQAMDINGDGKIDEKEQAAVFAAMDMNTAGMDGKITPEQYTGFSAALGDEDYNEVIKAKVQNAYSFVFGNNN